MKVHVVAARSDVCLISDRHAGLLQSIIKLQGKTATTPPLWPDVQNTWCIRHMGANFYDHFKNKDTWHSGMVSSISKLFTWRNEIEWPFVSFKDVTATSFMI